LQVELAFLRKTPPSHKKPTTPSAHSMPVAMQVAGQEKSRAGKTPHGLTTFTTLFVRYANFIKPFLSSPQNDLTWVQVIMLGSAK
jgi:hypothetical protein